VFSYCIKKKDCLFLYYTWWESVPWSL